MFKEYLLITLYVVTNCLIMVIDLVNVLIENIIKYNYYISYYLITNTLKFIKDNNLLTKENVYIFIIIIYTLFTYYLLFLKKEKKQVIISNTQVQNPEPKKVTTIIDLTDDVDDDVNDNDNDVKTESSYDSDKHEKMVLLTDDEYNQLLFDSTIHIWKKYGRTKWYYKKNEEDIKYIISQSLPERLMISTNLFMEYKGKPIYMVAENIEDDLIDARQLRPSINVIIREIYKIIKNSY